MRHLSSLSPSSALDQDLRCVSVRVHARVRVRARAHVVFVFMFCCCLWSGLLQGERDVVAGRDRVGRARLTLSYCDVVMQVHALNTRRTGRDLCYLLCRQRQRANGST